MLSWLRKSDQRLPGKPLVLLFLVGIVASGVFLRFYRIEDFRTEYDDVGVVAFHKAQASVRKSFILYSASIFDLQITKKDDQVAANLLDTPFFGPYIAFRWTYPMGQYLFYPAVIDEADSYHSKLVKGRAFSAVFSSVSLLLLALLLYRMNGGRWDENVLIPMGLLAFSFQSVIFAKHMSPYSLTATTLIVTLLLFWRLLRGRLCLFLFVSSLGVLTIFNYLVLIMVPPLGVLLLLRLRPFNWQDPAVRSLLRQAFASAAVFLALFLPAAALFFKPASGFHGVAPPPISDGVFPFLAYFPRQFLLTVSSTLACVTTWAPANLLLAVALTGCPVVAFVASRRFLGQERYLYGFAFLFLTEWVALHAMGKIILDQTRHELSWVPLYAILTFLLWKWAQPGRLLSYSLALLMIFSGVRANLKVIDERIERFDFERILANSAKTILTYGDTLAPLAYFQNTGKRVFLIDENYFAQGYDEFALEDRLLLASRISLDDYEQRRSRFYSRVARLFDEYDVIPLIGMGPFTGVVYQTVPSEPGDGFYVYGLVRRKVVTHAPNP